MPLSSATPLPLREGRSGPPFPLAGAYPALAHLLGPSRLSVLEEAFGAFLGTPPDPQAASYLPGFLSGARGFRDEPILAELATFEQALARAGAVTGPDPLPPTELDLLPEDAWPELRIGLHPALHRVDTEWNSVCLWQAVQQGIDLPPPAPLPEPRTWAVWAQGGRTRFRPLPPDDARALDLVARGYPFREICHTLCAWLPAREATPHATRMVGDWVDAGWVTDLTRAD